MIDKMNTLDLWEAEASAISLRKAGAWLGIISEQRILALIDLVRNKDRYLLALRDAYLNDVDHDYLGYLGAMNEALALTEQLE